MSQAEQEAAPPRGAAGDYLEVDIRPLGLAERLDLKAQLLGTLYLDRTIALEDSDIEVVETVDDADNSTREVAYRSMLDAGKTLPTQHVGLAQYPQGYDDEQTEQPERRSGIPKIVGHAYAPDQIEQFVSEIARSNGVSKVKLLPEDCWGGMGCTLQGVYSFNLKPEQAMIRQICKKDPSLEYELLKDNMRAHLSQENGNAGTDSETAYKIEKIELRTELLREYYDKGQELPEFTSVYVDGKDILGLDQESDLNAFDGTKSAEEPDLATRISKAIAQISKDGKIQLETLKQAPVHLKAIQLANPYDPLAEVKAFTNIYNSVRGTGVVATAFFACYGLLPDGSILPVIASEMIEGQHLDEYMDSHKLAKKDELRLFSKVLRALGTIHSKSGIAHWDVKPANIRVTEDERVVIIDFGLASRIGEIPNVAGLLKGTPFYWAPEHIRDYVLLKEKKIARPQTKSAPSIDVYSVGSMLYERVLGNAPLAKLVAEVQERCIATPHPDNADDSGDSNNDMNGELAAAAHKQMSEEAHIHIGQDGEIAPEDMDRISKSHSIASKKIAHIIVKSLRYDPANRYQTCEEMAEDLDAVVSEIEDTESICDRVSLLFSEHSIGAPPEEPQATGNSAPPRKSYHNPIKLGQKPRGRPIFTSVGREQPK